MSNIYSTLPKTLTQQYAGYAGWNLYSSAIRNTSGLLIMIPLVIMFLFCQKFLVQGIERSGITG
jgi:multiple sugar transport system permease protein